MSELWIVRHGETEWSRAMRHTGRTDLDLTDRGREGARALESLLGKHSFTTVITSPLKRAVETARLAGFGDRAQARDELMEWDYGDYEGRTTDEIRADRPEWSLWDDGCPGGERPGDVASRVVVVITAVRAAEGDTLIFGHSHCLRVLTARWLGLGADGGRFFVLRPLAVGVLGYERTTPVMLRWDPSPT